VRVKTRRIRGKTRAGNEAAKTPNMLLRSCRIGEGERERADVVMEVRSERMMEGLVMFLIKSVVCAGASGS